MSREGMCSTLDGKAAGDLLREVFAFDGAGRRDGLLGLRQDGAGRRPAPLPQPLGRRLRWSRNCTASWRSGDRNADLPGSPLDS